jgi:hypothetical protein
MSKPAYAEATPFRDRLFAAGSTHMHYAEARLLVSIHARPTIAAWQTLLDDPVPATKI